MVVGGGGGCNLKALGVWAPKLGPKCHPNGRWTAQVGTKMAPRWPPDPPLGAKVGPWSIQDGYKMRWAKTWVASWVGF